MRMFSVHRGASNVQQPEETPVVTHPYNQADNPFFALDTAVVAAMLERAPTSGAELAKALARCT